MSEEQEVYETIMRHGNTIVSHDPDMFIEYLKDKGIECTYCASAIMPNKIGQAGCRAKTRTTYLIEEVNKPKKEKWWWENEKN